MANEEHIFKLEQGFDDWDCWRKDNLEIIVDLSGADLRKVDIAWKDLSGVNLSGADLSGQDLSSTDLRRANLSGANLCKACLSEADLRGADLRRADLSEADFTDADLRGAVLSEANLNKTYLGGANLIGINLYKTDLREFNFQRANLSEANLTKANLSKANLSEANLRKVDLSGANLVGANLTNSSIIETKLKNTNLSGCTIYGISVWNVQIEDNVLCNNLKITPIGEADITVDNLEVAQFIYLLLNNKKIRDVINTITSKVVLILGRFTEERKKILDAIRDELRNLDFLPVMFDFEKPTARNTQETILTLASMSKFVIADMTDPVCVPFELGTIVRELSSVPIFPLLLKGKRPWGMWDSIEKLPWVQNINYYDDCDELIRTFKEKIIIPAESKL